MMCPKKKKRKEKVLYSSVDEPNEMPGVIYGNRLLITRQFWHKFQSNLHGQLLVNWFLPLYRRLNPALFYLGGGKQLCKKRKSNWLRYALCTVKVES